MPVRRDVLHACRRSDRRVRSARPGCSRSAGSLSSPSSTGSRCTPTCTRSTSCRPAARRCSRSRPSARSSSRRIARPAPATQLVREARRLGFVKPGEQLFIVRGIAAWRHRNHDAVASSRDRRGDRRAAARAARRARSGASPCAARSARRRSPSRRRSTSDGRPFPTQFYLTCPHLVAAHRAPRGGGRRRALDARAPETTRSSRRASREAHAEQRALRPELAAGIGGSTRDGQPQVPARPRGLRARAARLRARRPDPRRAAGALARRPAVLPD